MPPPMLTSITITISSWKKERYMPTRRTKCDYSIPLYTCIFPQASQFDKN